MGKSDSPANELLGHESCVDIDAGLVSTDLDMFSRTPANVAATAVEVPALQILEEVSELVIPQEQCSNGSTSKLLMGQRNKKGQFRR